MRAGKNSPAGSAIIEPGALQRLLDVLRQKGYRTVGPTVRDGAIVYDEIESTGELPAGWTDVQSGGNYRLERRKDGALFRYAVGPHSWKRFLHPPVMRLWAAERESGLFHILPESVPADRYALIGVRSCELHAMAVQDNVLASGAYSDPGYRQRREGAFVVAVQCGQAGGTCFCASMKTGPKVTFGYDLALTEVVEDGAHYLLAEAASQRGREVLGEVPHRPAGEEERAAADRVVSEAAAHMGRTMDTDGLKDLLYQSYEHPRWDRVAERCLSCASCTMVCPTCFCTTVEDTTDLTGARAERWRRWDSCFTADFSYIHGGSVRQSVKSRYRQWMTHKLATWWDQFGTSGCVGCGRCITWCPVGIDITEEAHAIRAANHHLSDRAPNGTARALTNPGEHPARSAPGGEERRGDA